MTCDWAWTKAGYNAQKCGDYTVTKHEISRVKSKWEYLAWRGAELIGTFDDGPAAKAACERQGSKK